MESGFIRLLEIGVTFFYRFFFFGFLTGRFLGHFRQAQAVGAPAHDIFGNDRRTFGKARKQGKVANQVDLDGVAFRVAVHFGQRPVAEYLLDGTGDLEAVTDVGGGLGRIERGQMKVDRDVFAEPPDDGGQRAPVAVGLAHQTHVQPAGGA